MRGERERAFSCVVDRVVCVVGSSRGGIKGNVRHEANNLILSLSRCFLSRSMSKSTSAKFAAALSRMLLRICSRGCCGSAGKFQRVKPTRSQARFPVAAAADRNEVSLWGAIVQAGERGGRRPFRSSFLPLQRSLGSHRDGGGGVLKARTVTKAKRVCDAAILRERERDRHAA